MIKFSIIIPCYNVEKYIDECLDSIINQTIGLKNLEIILIDDASADNTVNILKRYETRYPEQILLILNEKNQKQGTARNIGLQYATGNYISFVDADDWIDINMYKILDMIMSETNSDIVQFKHCYTSLYEVKEIKKIEDISIYNITNVIDVKKMLLDYSIYNLSCTAKAYKKSILIASKALFAEGTVYEEPMFTYPLQFYINKVCNINHELYYYRNNPEGTMNYYMKDLTTIEEHIAVQLDLFRQMKNKQFYNLYQEEINFHFLHSFLLETFTFLADRKYYMPYQLFNYLKKIIMYELPTYNDNYYIVHKVEIELVDVLDLINDSFILSENEMLRKFEEIYLIVRKRLNK